MKDMEKVESIVDRLPKSARQVKAEDIVSEIERQMSTTSIVSLYEEKILSQRTRQYELKAGGKSSRVEILHTLLGIELKIANRRLLCPDLATARYLAVFARLGCEVIAVPYDITQISRIADDLESSWQRMLLLMEHLTKERSTRIQSKVKLRLISGLREAIAKLGAGTKFPRFNQKTRQRS
jgi:hypothetical protein